MKGLSWNRMCALSLSRYVRKRFYANICAVHDLNQFALQFIMKLRNLLALSAVFVGFYIAGQLSVSAQNANGLLLTVNDIGDSSDVNRGDMICADANGRCSLRAAIEESNADL